jgi:hypothetical protein
LEDGEAALDAVCRGEGVLCGQSLVDAAGSEDAFNTGSPLLVITLIGDRTLGFLPHACFEAQGTTRWAVRIRRLGEVHFKSRGLVALCRSDTSPRAAAGGRRVVGEMAVGECCEVQKTGRAIRREA